MCVVATPSDLSVVRQAVARAGRARLLFTKADVAVELSALGGVRASSQSALDRQLAALLTAPSPAMYRLRTTLDVVVPGLGTRRTRTAPPGKQTARYILASRLHELDDAHPGLLDDRGRVLVATAMAAAVLGDRRGAPTRLITQCLRVVPELRLHHRQQTSVVLHALTRSPHAVLEAVVRAGNQRVWRSTLRLRPGWSDWIQRQIRVHYGALRSEGALARTQDASFATMASDLLRTAVEQSADPMWPLGRPLSVRACEALCTAAASTEHSDGPTRSRLEALAYARGGFAGALRAAARASFSDGSTRRKAVVREIAVPAGHAPLYAPASIPAAYTDAWTAWHELRASTDSDARAKIQAEWALVSTRPDCVPAAVAAWDAATRVALAEHAGDALVRIRSLERAANGVSPLLHTQVAQRRAALEAITKAWPRLATLRQEANARLRPLGVTLQDVLEVEPVLIDADTLAAYLPRRLRDERTPAQLLGSVSAVRRQRAKGLSAPTRVGEGRAARIRIPSCDAVLAAAEMAMLPGVLHLTSAKAMLGGTLSHPGLLQKIFRTGDAQWRVTAVAGLVLLGARTAAGELVRSWAARQAKASVGLEAAALVELSYWLDGSVRDDLLRVAACSRDNALQRAVRDLRIAVLDRER